MGWGIEQLRALGVDVDKVTTFAELDRICDTFINGYKGQYPYPFLIILGTPGLSKTHRFRDDPGYFAGTVSAVGLYTFFYNHRNETLIFDDVDALFRDKTIVGLLKALLNDSPTKKISWGKQNSVLDAEGIPRSFETSSRCCIVLNELPKAFGVNDRAVLTRGKTVSFQPDVHEVHRYVGTWFRDTEIYDFIGANLASVTVPSCRWYKKALQEKTAGIDWRAWLMTQWTNDEKPYLSMMAKVIAKFSKSGEQLKEWKTNGPGYSRSQFFRIKSEYVASHGPRSKIVMPTTIAVEGPKSQEIGAGGGQGRDYLGF